jgi:hypothetical protein
MFSFKENIPKSFKDFGAVCVAYDQSARGNCQSLFLPRFCLQLLHWQASDAPITRLRRNSKAGDRRSAFVYCRWQGRQPNMLADRMRR